MKHTLKVMTVLFATILMSCGGKEEKKKDELPFKKKAPTEKVETVKEEKVLASKKVDLENKGVGPITSITLDDTIDQKMANRGEEVFKQMCTACHRTDKKFIGPAPKGILERRSPEWIMNMILDPEGMVKNDPLAKELLEEFNGSPMANQHLSEADARAVLEYFRTL
ncbi:cytochrome c [Oceanihabitans sediminis]|uniref:Cytochrome c n=1 Tax=Oceanihabitans sediminis TaxID=1812012 RepID=A0A368P2H8_9FLAO|nr:cytochrome c [Oceanihabitans sediminis]MDX1278246.1 cytochrome c [Oceanihabitans sediminis]MDX1774610.1 cytochrome c [Oceanihabitans sediminis]RBP28993.1 mono/diheme cytochrome c family protein [Oceanihabitans sediminis]RCU57077.1 cytochrome c [Oceanihabitans sediminis]